MKRSKKEYESFLKENDTFKEIIEKSYNTPYFQSNFTMEEYMKGFSDEASKEAFLLSLSSFSFNRPIVKISIRGTELAFSIKLSGELKIKNFKSKMIIK